MIHRRRILLVTLIIFITVLCAVAGIKAYQWYQGQFVRLGDWRYPKDSTELDLRDQKLSVSDYRELCALLPGCTIHWMVPVQNQLLDQDALELVLTCPTSEDLETVSLLPRLEVLTVLDCQDPEALLALKEQFPQLELHYTLSLDGKQIDNDVTTLLLNAPSPEELQALLPHLTKLTKLRLEGTLPSCQELDALEQAFPGVGLEWSVSQGGRSWDRSSREVDFSGLELSPDRLLELLSYLPEAEIADITDCGLSEEDFRRAADAFPGLLFRGATITLLGQEVPSDAEELDISGIKLTDTLELEAALPYLRNLKKVDMCRCGLSNEEMDALNSRYEDIRFVWEVVICTRRFRTDATGFIVAMVDSYTVNTASNEEVGQLRYCTDMISVDVGHMSSLTSCEWAAYMPNLQYLIIGETHISDLTPLTGLKNLVWLEMFDVPVTDLSALVEITSLEDLNLGGILCDPAPIAQMTWLKNLWWFGVKGRTDVPARFAPEILPEALPNTNIVFSVAHATAGGWRKLPNYYKMRDALGMGYSN